MNAEQAKRHNPLVWMLGLIALVVALGIGTTTQATVQISVYPIIAEPFKGMQQ